MSEPRPERLRVLHIVTRLNIGGATLALLQLSRGLSAQGAECAILFGSCDRQDGDMSYALDPADRTVQVVSLVRPIAPVKDLIALIGLYRAIRHYRPHVVHTHLSKAGFLGRLAARLAGVPAIVHTFHGNTLAGYFHPLAMRLFRALERRLARVTNAICVVSPQQQWELGSAFQIARPEKFRVIPLGLDQSAYLGIPAARPQNSRLVVGWIGRLVAIKNVPLLVSIVDNVLRTTGRIHFVIAGDGPDRPLLDPLLDRYPSGIEYLGWVQDIQPMLQRVDVLIQTSKNEGTPVALIQGMAAGRPFISTRAGGVVDMTMGEPSAFGGATWFENAVLAAESPESFTGTLLRLLSRPELVASMGQAAREFARSTYGPENFVRQTLQLYRQVLEGATVPHRAGGGEGNRIPEMDCDKA